MTDLKRKLAAYAEKRAGEKYGKRNDDVSVIQRAAFTEGCDECSALLEPLVLKMAEALELVMWRHKGRNEGYDKCCKIAGTEFIPQEREGGQLLAYHHDAVDMEKIAREVLARAAELMGGTI